MPDNDDWITVQNACELTGYTGQYLRRLLRNRSIDAKKFGHVWMISHSSLMAYWSEAQHKADKDRRYSPKSSE